MAGETNEHFSPTEPIRRSSFALQDACGYCASASRATRFGHANRAGKTPCSMREVLACGQQPLDDVGPKMADEPDAIDAVDVDGGPARHL